MPQIHTRVYLLATLLGPAWVNVQQAGSTPASIDEARTRPSTTITAGVGNAFGWAGLQGERYFGNGRLSVFAGLGYIADSDEDDRLPTGAAWAAGARAFTPGFKHRGFVEVSVSEVARAWRQRVPGPVEQKHLYGPGLQIGYQWVADSGFTFSLSAGVGLALDGGFSDVVHAAAGLALGYSWRPKSE